MTDGRKVNGRGAGRGVRSGHRAHHRGAAERGEQLAAQRHDDFPKPVGGTDKSPRFDLAAVEAWLRSQGRAAEIPADERLWQAFESARGIMPTGTRWSRPGCCCTTSSATPERR